MRAADLFKLLGYLLRVAAIKYYDVGSNRVLIGGQKVHYVIHVHQQSGSLIFKDKEVSLLQRLSELAS